VFALRISDDDHGRLNELAEHYGISASSTVCLLVRDRHREVVEPVAAKATRRRAKYPRRRR
jgi:hypothetical protein